MKNITPFSYKVNAESIAI